MSMTTQQPIAVATQEGDYNFYAENLDQCLKGTSEFLQTVYTNVCSGETYAVANGFWDYIGLFIMAFIGIMLVLIVLKFILD